MRTESHTEQPAAMQHISNNSNLDAKASMSMSEARPELDSAQHSFAHAVSRRATSHRIILIIVAIAIVFTAAVLRSTITSMGALSVYVQTDLGLSSSAIGMVTTLPLLAFAASALVMNKISERFGNSRALAIGCAAVALGIVWRSYGGDVGLFGGTILLGVGISAGNVLLPAVARERFPASVGIMTALYTTTMCLFAGGAAGASSLLMNTLPDWRAILMMMAPIAGVGALLWIVVRCLSHKSGDRRMSSTHKPKRTGLFSAHILKNPITWWITALFGAQSILFYGIVAWLPSILAAAGVSNTAITICVTLFPILGIPCTLFIPPLAQRLKRQRALGAIVGLLCTLGVVVLFFAHSDEIAIAAAALLGFALGAPFCLCMFYFGVRTEDPDDAAKLSSISQTFGYLLAALGPACLGLIVDLSGSWSLPLLIMFALAASLVICGWKAGAGMIPAPQSNDDN